MGLRVIAMLVMTYVFVMAWSAPAFAAVDQHAQDEQAAAAEADVTGRYIDPFALVEMLRRDEIAALDDKLNGWQQQYEADTNREYLVKQAANAFAFKLPELEEDLNRWVEQRPQSYMARVARAKYLNNIGWTFRGTGYYEESPESRRKAAEHYISAAQKDLEAALQLTPRPVQALAQLLAINKYRGERENLDANYAQAKALDPYCTEPVWAYLDALYDNWLGEENERSEFIDRLRETSKHEKILRLLKHIDSYKLTREGRAHYRRKKYTDALKLFQQSDNLIHNAWAQEMLAWTYYRVNQLGLAMNAVNQALEMDPGDLSLYSLRGDIYYAKNQREAAKTEYRKAAEYGDIRVMATLAYNLGAGEKGYQQDFAESMYWHLRAAHFQHAYSQFSIGKLYEAGSGVKADYAEAAKWYRLAVEQGYGLAQNNLGLMLWYGRGVEQDQQEAARLWRLAADQGVQFGQHNLKFFLNEEYPLNKPKKDAAAKRRAGPLTTVLMSLPYVREISAFLMATRSRLETTLNVESLLRLLALMALLCVAAVLLFRRLVIAPHAEASSDANMQQILGRELNGAERLLWWGGPTKANRFVTSYPVIAAYLLLIFAVLIWLQSSLLGKRDFWELAAAAFFLLLGIRAAVVAPILNGMRLARTVYGISDQRVIIIERISGRWQYFSIPLTALRELAVLEKSDGSGDIVITSNKQQTLKQNPLAAALGVRANRSCFEGIADVHEVNQKLRELVYATRRHDVKQNEGMVTGE